MFNKNISSLKNKNGCKKLNKFNKKNFKKKTQSQLNLV